MKLLLILVFAYLLGSACLPSRAQLSLPSKETSKPETQVAFLPVPGLALVEKNTYRYETGTIDPVRTPRLERSFILKNATSQPLTIGGLRGSCGCETLLLLKGDTAVPKVSLAPGEQATIRLTVNLHTGLPGAVRKYVWIDDSATGSEQASPLLTLEVDILLRPSVSFTPSFLNFGKIEAGTGAKMALTVSFDPDLFPATSPPLLSSTSPAVQARPLGLVQRVQEDGKPRLHQTYQVVLSPSAHAGQISSDLSLGLPSSTGGKFSASKVSLAVTGDVAGAIDALPASVFFGSLPTGKPVTRLVVLTLASATIGPMLKVTSSSPWLHAALNQPDTSSKQILLSVSLTNQAPFGPIQGKIMVSVSNGEHLDIPVIAELTR